MCSLQNILLPFRGPILYHGGTYRTEHTSSLIYIFFLPGGELPTEHVWGPCTLRVRCTTVLGSTVLSKQYIKTKHKPSQTQFPLLAYLLVLHTCWMVWYEGHHGVGGKMISNREVLHLEEKLFMNVDFFTGISILRWAWMGTISYHIGKATA